MTLSRPRIFQAIQTIGIIGMVIGLAHPRIAHWEGSVLMLGMALILCSRLDAGQIEQTWLDILNDRRMLRCRLADLVIISSLLNLILIRREWSLIEWSSSFWSSSDLQRGSQCLSLVLVAIALIFKLEMAPFGAFSLLPATRSIWSRIGEWFSILSGSFFFGLLVYGYSFHWGYVVSLVAVWIVMMIGHLAIVEFRQEEVLNMMIRWMWPLSLINLIVGVWSVALLGRPG